MKYDNVTFFRYATFVRDAICCPDNNCDEVVAQATLAVTVVDNGKYNVSAAIVCNASDNFNKEIGRTIAHQRMITGDFVTIDQEQVSTDGIVYAYGQALRMLQVKPKWLPASLLKSNIRIASRLNYF